MRIHVIWTDGCEETYDCEDCAVANGALILYPPRRGPVEPKRGIPLDGVRLWEEE